MSSRQNLLQEISSLRQVLIKEWLKQAYFRKEKNIEYTIINDELHDIEKSFKTQISIQEEFLSTKFPDLEDLEEYTPRFLTTQHAGLTDYSSPFASVLKILAAFKQLQQQSFENERAIISRYQNLQVQEVQGSLLQKYEKEKEKVNKLTQKYNDLNLEFLNVQEMMEDLSYQREHSKPCENCMRLKEKVRDLEDQLRVSPNSELQRFKEMYEELKAAHDEIAEELNAQPREHSEEFDHERDNFLKQMNYLQESQKKLEGINADLMKKLESESSQVIKLSGFIDEYEEEIRKKNSALDRAQNIIKKLNAECEKLAKDLERVTNENDGLKKENRNLVKTKTGVEKKRSDIEIMKKTEERLRDELSTLKNKYAQAMEQYENQVNQLNIVLLQQSQEKNNLELTLEELEQKLSEIDAINKKRVEEFTQACVRIQELEDQCKKKDEILQKLTDDLERTISNKDQEYQHLKKQAENMIRHLTSLTNASKPNKPDKPELKNSEIGKESLNEQLQEALNRENKLKSLVNNIINTEGQNLKNLLNNINKITTLSRAETERWIMRNEELEQRILELSEKNLRLNTCIKDLQKMLHFKNMQFDEYSKNADNCMKELQSKIDFLTQELSNTYNLISQDILPNSQKTMYSNLGMTHEKIHDLRQENDQLKEHIISSEEALDKMQMIIKSLEDEKDSISKLLYRSNATIVCVDKHLGEVHPCQIPSEKGDRLSIIPESENIANEISEQGKIIVQKILILKDNEKRYVDRINQNNYELLQYQKTLEDKIEKHKLFESDLEKIQDENRYLTEIAYKEKEEKIKLRTVLNESTANEEKITALTDYVNKLNDEKDKLDENCNILRNELDKTQGILLAKTQQLEDVKECNLREISNLKLELEAVVKESKLLDPSSKILEMQEIINEQYHSIQMLQEKLAKSETKLIDALGQTTPERDQTLRASSRIKDLEERLKACLSENYDMKNELQRRETNKSPGNYASHLERLISQKNEMIATLEKELGSVKDSNFETVHVKNLSEELEKMTKKKESDRKNFQKRVKEFELVLRYIEDKINSFMTRNFDPKSEKMQGFIEDLARKNPNLTSWLKTLVGNLERLSLRNN